MLITGSTGMLGQELMSAAFNENYEVIGLHQNVHNYEPEASLRISQLLCDITNVDIIERIASLSPDIIIHAAAYTNVDGCEQDPDKAWQVNVVGTENVAKSAAKCGAIFLNISTDYVFDGTKSSPYIETDIPSPISVYGRSKLKGEEAAKALCADCFIIRTAWLFGKGRTNFVNRVIDFAKKGGDLIAWSDQKSSPTYSRDLAEAILHMLNKINNKGQRDAGLSGIYHITNTGNCSRYEVAKEVLEHCGAFDKMPKLVKLSEAGCIAPRPQMSALDNSRYSAVFGRPMRRWNDAVREYVGVYCNENERLV